MLHPVYRRTVLLLLYGNMAHSGGCRCAMPVFFVWFEVDHIAGMDIVPRSALSLYPAASASARIGS